MRQELLCDIHHEFSEVLPQRFGIVAMFGEVCVRPSLRQDSHLPHPLHICAVIMARWVLATRILDHLHIVSEEHSRRVPKRFSRPERFRPKDLRDEVVLIPNRPGNHAPPADPELLHDDGGSALPYPCFLAVNDISPPPRFVDSRVPWPHRSALPAE